MHRMRALVAFALLVFGVGGIMSAGAADLGAGVGVRGGGHDLEYSAIGGPTPPLIEYDYEPGAVARTYWLAP
jgi:hypothetical protein